MSAMISKKLVFILLLANLAVAQKTPQALSTPTPLAKPSLALPEANQPQLDLQSLMKETEHIDMRRHRMGIFWWVPPDYWELSLRQQGYDRERMGKIYDPFKKYNLFIVAVGDVRPGDVTWREEADVKKSLLLRDQHGNTYKALDETPAEMASVVELMKPVFKRMMGNFGGGLQFIFFPLKDSAGNVFADPYRSSELFLDVADFVETGPVTYNWHFPLTALAPAKFCPVGKEKVEAHWKYCPWHGNKLMDDAGQTAVSTTK